MKKSTSRFSVIIIIAIVAVVGYYAYLSNKSRAIKEETAMSFVESTLSRNLYSNYPPTPKEVLRYYNELQKCIYNEEPTAEQMEALVLKLRELLDQELLDQNSLAMHTIRLEEEVREFKEKKRKITGMAVASSANVIYDTVDGYEFAKLNCSYNVMEDGTSNPTTQVFLLRKDGNRKWKIYGWKIMGTEDAAALDAAE